MVAHPYNFLNAASRERKERLIIWLAGAQRCVSSRALCKLIVCNARANNERLICSSNNPRRRFGATFEVVMSANSSAASDFINSRRVNSLSLSWLSQVLSAPNAARSLVVESQVRARERVQNKDAG